MFNFGTERLNFKINVIAFSVVGTVYYFYRYLLNPSILDTNLLYVLGPWGLCLAVFGGSLSYYYYRYGVVAFYRIVGLTIGSFFAWLIGLVVISKYSAAYDTQLLAVVWIGVLTVMYFMLIGAIQGWFGYWICVFNLLVLLEAVLIGESINPLVWVNILGVIGIENQYFQWFIVLLSSLLSVSDKGFEFIQDI